VLNLVRELEQKGARLKVPEPEIDIGGPMGSRPSRQLSDAVARRI
jgi:hypothetical protein